MSGAKIPDPARARAPRRWKRRAMVAGLVAFSLLLVAAIAIVAAFGKSWIAGGITVAPNAGRTFRIDDDAQAREHQDIGIDEQLRVELARADAKPVSLSVWIIEPKGEPRGTVLVLHGIRADKLCLKGLAERVADEGYRAILPDLPGHGRSSGDFLTYGVHEAPALKALLDELSKRGRLSGSVGVVGLSYGAATGIQLAALDTRVRAVVAIAPFSSLRAVVPGYAQYYLPVLSKLIPDSFIQQGVDEAGTLGKFDVDAASSLTAISRTQAQVLLIHGLADQHIAPAQSIALHAAARDHSELVLLEDEDQFSIAADRTNTIQRRGMQWLHRWLD
jgi:uncharacterized protein